jgi:hypothetical protein
MEQPFGLRALSYWLGKSRCYGAYYLDSRISQGASRLREGGTCRHKVIYKEGPTEPTPITLYNKGAIEIIPAFLDMQPTLIAHFSLMSKN